MPTKDRTKTKSAKSPQKRAPEAVISMPAQSTWSRGMPWWSGLEDPVTEELMRAVTALEPRRVLCLDRSFRGNDELKTNTVLEMRSHDIEFQTV